MSLIDKYLPDSQFAERHGIPVFAPAEKLMAAVVAYDPASDPLIRGLQPTRAEIADHGRFLRKPYRAKDLLGQIDDVIEDDDKKTALRN